MRGRSYVAGAPADNNRCQTPPPETSRRVPQLTTIQLPLRGSTSNDYSTVLARQNEMPFAG